MSQLHHEFKQQLSHELNIAQTLHQLLIDERKLLMPPDLKALERLQTQKQTELEKLQASTDKRCAWLSSRSIPLDKHCITHPLLQHNDPTENDHLRQLWQQLADQFAANRLQTEVLGQIVFTAQQRTQSMMNILRGQKNAPNLYSKSGKALNSSDTTGYARA